MDVQQLFKSLRKEAECPLCLETVKDPKTLPCLHSFCLVCLDKHANYARRQLQTAIKCPVCQASFQIPQEDTFGGLPASFHLNRLVDLLALTDGGTESQQCDSCEENNTATHYCFECQSFLCTTCFKAHQRIKATRGHKNIAVDNLQADDVEMLIRRPVMCSEQYHQDQPLEYYCKDCNVCTCIKCSVVSHNQHTMVDMQKAADEQKMQIDEVLKKVKAEVVIFENEMKDQTELMNKNKTQISAAREKMNETVDDRIRLLTEHKASMNAKFDEINQVHQKAHATHLENFQLAVAQLKSSLEQGENILERNINAEILQTKPVIIGRCEDLLNAKKPEIYKPPRVHYAVEQKLDISDRVVVSHTDPSSTLVKGLCEKVEEQNETYFTIITRDLEERQSYNDDDINCEIRTSTGDSLRKDLKIEDAEDGSYTIKYKQDHIGLYDVKIEINGQPLDGSPWTVQVIPHQYQLKFSFGSCGNRAGNFNYPCGVAVSEKTGTIAISDYSNNRIQLFSSNWNYLNEIRLGSSCSSVSFTESDQIISATPHDVNKICLFAKDGKFVQHINSKHLQCPSHISIGKDDSITSSDPINHVFEVISPDGTKLLKRFRASEHHDSIKCAIYHEQKFFVSDCKAHRVGVYDEDGILLYDIGSKESGDGHLAHPSGLAIDTFNNLLVCDVGKSSVQVFTREGKFVSMFGLSSFAPNYVAVSKNGDVFVTDHVNHCVHVFH